MDGRGREKGRLDRRGLRADLIAREGEHYGHQDHHRHARLRVLGSSALTAVVNAVVGAIQKKRGKATTQEAHLAEIDKKLGKMQEHQDEQYLAILRLTIMSEEMPMAERLIAGEKYKKMGGNGDVKKFLHQLEAQCERNGV